tara:strand:+ start:320 stop:520 length:201 start_codon:yes stop_codon:yes gene_type:complete
MTNRVFFISIVCIITIAILISLAPEEKWDSIYEEIASRTNILLDIILKLLGIMGLTKYLFLSHAQK